MISRDIFAKKTPYKPLSVIHTLGVLCHWEVILSLSIFIKTRFLFAHLKKKYSCSKRYWLIISQYYVFFMLYLNKTIFSGLTCRGGHCSDFNQICFQTNFDLKTVITNLYSSFWQQRRRLRNRTTFRGKNVRILLLSIPSPKSNLYESLTTVVSFRCSL